MSSEDPTIQALQRDLDALDRRERYLREEQAKSTNPTDRAEFGYAAAFCNIARWRGDCYGQMGDRYEELGDDARAQEATDKALHIQKTEFKPREEEEKAARRKLVARLEREAEMAEVGTAR